VEDCRRLCLALNIPLGDANGNGQPTFTSSMICFNGHVDSGKLSSTQQTEGLIWPRPGWLDGPVTPRILGPNGDGSYETFLVQQVHSPRFPMEQAVNGWWDWFFKTSYRPYDLCVQGCLMVLSHHLDNTRFRVRSDGTTEKWNQARHACQHVLGYGIDWGEDDLAPVAVSPPPAVTETSSS
jgi:hypothetical protein